MLQGYSDVDGDTISVQDLTVSSGSGSLTDNRDGTWIFAPSQDFHGDISLNYLVSDSNGGTTNANQSFSLVPVNDAPVSTGDVDFGSIDEDSSFTISATDGIEKLLSTTTDVDGDTLTIDNLRLVEGEGTLIQNIDGSYTFTPAENYNGLISGSYTINDGNGGSIDANATLTAVSYTHLTLPTIAKV